jgi:hypothetical protein
MAGLHLSGFRVLNINITGSNIEAQQQLSLDSAKDINIQAGYDGSLNESYSKTSGFSLAGLVGIGSLYSSTEDLEGRIKRTAVNSNLSGNNITLNANNNIHVVGDLYFFVFRIIGIGVVGILDVDIFGITTNAIVCLNVNTHCMNVVVGIKRNVICAW